MQKSCSTTPNSIKINITIPVSESHPEHIPHKSSCANCSSCGNCKQVSECGPLLQHAAKILTNMFGGQYTPQQTADGFEILDQLLRRHYSNKQ
ncbi:MAG: hypothetical protein H8E17_08700 [Deltaproteobacteria bacterium]|nr:hypothetical protein [Deltaproteobacteria bacterium]